MFSYNHGYQSSCAYDAKHWQTLWSVALNYKRQSTHTCSILPFFSVNSSVVISTAEGGGMGIKVRNRHWHGRVRSVLWLATASCVHPRGFFFRGQSLPYTRWLQRTSRPICDTNLLNKGRYIYTASSQVWGQPLRCFENIKSGLWAQAT